MGGSTMVGKRQTKTGKPDQDDPGKPSRWRLQHDLVTAPLRESDPETGAPVTHRRIIDTLGQLLANGAITPQMHEAGCMFRSQFRSAMLDGMRVSSLVRVTGSDGDTPGERQAAARTRVANAIAVFGGVDSACGSCLWHVVGLEHSLREWAGHRGWGGRSVHHVQAQGILVGALNVLAVHYGLIPRVQAA